MFERFTEGARQSVKVAQEEARSLGHPYVGTEHLLLGVIAVPGSAADILVAHQLSLAILHRRLLDKGGDQTALDAEALATLGIDLDRVREATEANLGPGVVDRKPRKSVKAGHLPLTRRAKKVFELALREAAQLKSGEISSGHLLLGLLDEGAGLGAELLRDGGLDPGTLRAELVKLIGDRAVA